MQKYGLKNVAEKKFSQLIGSCILQQNQLHRIRLFGRFIEIYNDLTPSDYNKYLEMVDLFTNQILNFKIDDDLETILLPVVRLNESLIVVQNRAVDYYKLKFESKLLTLQFNQKMKEVIIGRLLIF